MGSPVFLAGQSGSAANGFIRRLHVVCNQCVVFVSSGQLLVVLCHVTGLAYISAHVVCGRATFFASMVFKGHKAGATVDIPPYQHTALDSLNARPDNYCGGCRWQSWMVLAVM